MEVCYWALLFKPLVILHHLLNVFVQLPNKRGLKKKTFNPTPYTLGDDQLGQNMYCFIM
jgi:hypothetical protein